MFTHMGTGLSANIANAETVRCHLMPWIDQEMCTACGICVDECPVGAIDIEDNVRAAIVESDCIRCGRCHDACPQEAVRHDSERIPQEVAANLQWVSKLLDHFQSPSECVAFMARIGRHFNKQKKVIERTLAALNTVGEDTANDLDAAIRSTLESRERRAN